MPLMITSEAIAKLKAAILAVQTVGEIHALIVDYTYEEIEQAYSQLTPQQQTKIQGISDRDIQRQLAALQSSHRSPTRSLQVT
ncbi:MULTISPECIES: hypothetical protein [unclassified Coleofasciculus]|uniref:hypothetical protein n=1 Tax=unclassified Coleofasciculus TaxID=2692782 RepID=UPI001882C05C|nr:MULTISPECIES: hypothetical protein [unclassified Coleofasciculus]MBE9128272.1 hypothetical protein [Coleofasciculus sp. LEGE 07081]MBE9151319.1 hypothetical protein [Coleofasciculus sp. LEGE 07092]